MQVVKTIVREKEAAETVGYADVVDRIATLRHRVFRLCLKELEELIEFYDFLERRLIVAKIEAKKGRLQNAVKLLEIVEEDVVAKEMELTGEEITVGDR